MIKDKCDCENHYMELTSYDRNFEPYYIRMCCICGKWWAEILEYIDTGILLYADDGVYCTAYDKAWKQVPIESIKECLSNQAR